jgi:DNA replication protein DnaC
VYYESLGIVGIPKEFYNTHLDDFDTSGGMEKVVSFVADYLKNFDDNFRKGIGIFFYGSNGVGKTMLSSIILRYLYEYRVGCKRVTLAEYLRAYTSLWEKHGEEREYAEQDFHTRYKNAEVLVIDEVGKEFETRVCSVAFEELIRYRDENGLVTIMCSNLEPKVFQEKYGNSLYSLIRGKLIPVRMEGSDKRNVKR